MRSARIRTKKVSNPIKKKGEAECMGNPVGFDSNGASKGSAGSEGGGKVHPVEVRPRCKQKANKWKKASCLKKPEHSMGPTQKKSV